MKSTRDMSDRHESRLARLLGGRMTIASGSTARDPADVKQEHGSGRFVFVADGKSTLGKSIGVTREMWAKIKEQSHWGRPMLALLFYGDERLTKVDVSLIAVDENDFVELIEAAAAADQVRELAKRLQEGRLTYLDRYGSEGQVDLANDLLDILDGREPSRGSGMGGGS